MSTPLFDVHVIVDWSSSGKPNTGKDSIWIAALGDAPQVLNPSTRAQTMDVITAILDAATAKGQRVFMGFDFAFGYPKGLSSALGDTADWRDVWALIAREITDADNNENNRFDAAAKLNQMFDGDGPFWANGLKRDIAGLPRKKPTGWGDTLPANLRRAEACVKNAQEVWKLSGAGSVGGQALTGIARLEHLRQSRNDLTIWPFQTFGEGRGHVAAEVFPSLIEIAKSDDQPHDKTQVETHARALRQLDHDGILSAVLSAPKDQSDILHHEASILGLGHKIALQKAADTPITPVKKAPRLMRPYEKDPLAIYAASFATVRSEAKLDRFDAGMERLAIRLIHACGMVEVADRLAYSKDAYMAGHEALAKGAPILCDCEMVGAGIIRRYLPADNQVIVTLNDPRTPDHAKTIGNTRSAAAVEFWADHLEGAVVAIGNAPTALFHLLELIDQGAPKPAVILGFPVGFVGAAESKAELAANPRGCDFVALRGRRGGSAIASAAVNALAVGLPEIGE
ncbi:precorrin-8X methylmutase [Pacificibacter marinus]|uniref:Precorrin-8X methylmutase n=2 Tax=Pacificibacter marinus TaxID=658057 RepID=A0A1Y5S5H7_9RHOB|nr:precorrin-8X methylmutase [Pacificibacter marinus]SLN32138.1 Precorrin-8X methylmutase [Pacificibacter marinus]